MTTSTLVPAGDEFSGGKGLGLFGRGDQRRYSREIDRVKAEAAIAATEERASIALANLHEQGRGLIANTAMTELGALVALEQIADAHRAVAKGGVRGRYVIIP